VFAPDHGVTTRRSRSAGRPCVSDLVGDTSSSSAPSAARSQSPSSTPSAPSSPI